MQNRDFRTWITCLYWTQTSPVVLCMQNSVLSIRFTSLYGSLPSSVDFAGNTATLGPKLHVSMCPSPHLWFLHAKQRIKDENYKSLWVPALICGFVLSKQRLQHQVSMGPCPHLWFYESKTATLWPELIVSMGPKPHLGICACKTEYLPPELLVSMCPRLLLWIHACKTETLGPELQVSKYPRHLLGICACKTETLELELPVSIGPRPHLWFCACKTACLASDLLVSMGPCPHLLILPGTQRLKDENCKSLWVPALICGFVLSKQRI